MSDIAYRGLSIAEKIFKDVVWDSLFTLGTTALYTEVPFLAPFSVPINWMLKIFTDKFYNGLVLFIDVQAISLVNQAHKIAYDKASITLKVIAHDKGIESKEYLDAKENAIKALAKFVSFGGH